MDRTWCPHTGKLVSKCKALYCTVKLYLYVIKKSFALCNKLVGMLTSLLVLDMTSKFAGKIQSLELNVPSLQSGGPRCKAVKYGTMGVYELVSLLPVVTTVLPDRK